jgi:hypothetical protein
VALGVAERDRGLGCRCGRGEDDGGSAYQLRLCPALVALAGALESRRADFSEVGPVVGRNAIFVTAITAPERTCVP